MGEDEEGEGGAGGWKLLVWPMVDGVWGYHGAVGNVGILYVLNKDSSRGRRNVYWTGVWSLGFTVDTSSI